MSETLVLRLRLRPEWSQGRSQASRPPDKSLSINLKIQDSFSKVSVSVSNFETTMQSQSQNAIVGLTHHRFWKPQRKLISCELFTKFLCENVCSGSY